MGVSMWLMIAAGTVAFWLFVVWVVKEVFSPGTHARHRMRQPAGGGHLPGAETDPAEDLAGGYHPYRYGYPHAGRDDDPHEDRPSGPGVRDGGGAQGADPWRGDSRRPVSRRSVSRRDEAPAWQVSSALDVLEQRLARGEIDVDEYARVRRALVESDPTLSRDDG